MNYIPFTRSFDDYEISRFSPSYFWGGANPRRALTGKEKAKRKARRLMSAESRRRNRR